MKVRETILSIIKENESKSFRDKLQTAKEFAS